MGKKKILTVEKKKCKSFTCKFRPTREFKKRFHENPEEETINLLQVMFGNTSDTASKEKPDNTPKPRSPRVPSKWTIHDETPEVKKRFFESEENKKKLKKLKKPKKSKKFKPNPNESHSKLPSEQPFPQDPKPNLCDRPPPPITQFPLQFPLPVLSAPYFQLPPPFLYYPYPTFLPLNPINPNTLNSTSSRKFQIEEKEKNPFDNTNTMNYKS